MEESSRRLGADEAEARAAGAGLRADGHQSPIGIGAAGFHEVSGGQRHRQAANPAADADRAGRSCSDSPAGTYVLHADASALQVRAKNDRGTAPPGAGAHRTAPGLVLRCQQNRRARFADHERRRRRPQSDRNGAGGIRRRADDRSHRARLLNSYQRDHDRRRVRHPAGLRVRDQQSVCDDSADFPRTAEN